MAVNVDTSLKTKLLRLECHFTWGLTKNDTDPNNLETRLLDDSNFYLGMKERLGYLYSLIAFTKFLQDQPEEALKSLKKAEELIREYNGDDCEVRLIVIYGDFAWLHYHLGNQEKCVEWLEKLEALKQQLPNKSLNVVKAEIYGEKGWTFLKYSSKFYEKANECFQKALEEQPEDIEWNIGYAIALHRLEDDLTCAEDSPAVKQLRRALEIDPENPLLMALLGTRLSLYKKYKEAAELVRRALEIAPENPHVTRYGAKFFRHHGCVDESIALLKKALEQAPNSAFLHHQISLCYKRKKTDLCKNGRYTQRAELQELLSLGIHHMEKAVVLKPSFICAKAELALLYAECKNFTEAEKEFKDTFELARAKNDHLATVHYYYGDFQLYHIKSESEAIKYYKKALRMRSSSINVRQCFKRLTGIAERRVSRNPRDGEAFGILGFVHQKKGEKKEAIECYEKALWYDRGNEEYLSALTDLHLCFMETPSRW